RRRALVTFATSVALAVAGCGATGGDDRPERDATLMLDGPRAGVHAGIASAVARGYDEAEGVNLRLLDGRATPRTLTTGRATFAGAGSTPSRSGRQPAARADTSAPPSRAMRERGTTMSKPAASARSRTSASTWE